LIFHYNFFCVFFLRVLFFQLLNTLICSIKNIGILPNLLKMSSLEFNLASSNSLPIFFGSYSTSSLDNIALVLFSLAIFCQSLVVCKVSNPLCRNPNLTKCGGEAQHLEKLGIWSPPGLPNVQSSTARGKTPRIGVFLVSLERS
jgi:hypothetical protein